MRFDSRDLTVKLTAQPAPANTDACCGCTDTQDQGDCGSCTDTQGQGDCGSCTDTQDQGNCGGCSATQPGCHGHSGNQYHAGSEVHGGALALLRHQLRQTLAADVR